MADTAYQIAVGGYQAQLQAAVSIVAGGFGNVIGADTLSMLAQGVGGLGFDPPPGEPIVATVPFRYAKMYGVLAVPNLLGGGGAGAAAPGAVLVALAAALTV